MYEARSSSQAVGKGALEAMEARGRRWAARKRKETSVGLAKINGPIELGVSERHECKRLRRRRSNGWMGRSNGWMAHFLSRTLVNVLDNDTVKIDFKPMYQCIHIYDTLDAREELQLSYQADRRARSLFPSYRFRDNSADEMTFFPPGTSVLTSFSDCLPEAILPCCPLRSPRRNRRVLPDRISSPSYDQFISIRI